MSLELRRILLALLLVPVTGRGADPPPSSPKPNIVFFLVDDMGWQETSVPFHSEVTELNRRYRTPHMERLAAEGMKFTQAYASAVCSPTRVSALTGMNVARHRVTNWTLRKNASPDSPHPTLQPPAWNVNGICTDDSIERTMQVTPLPGLLRTAGYRTIHVGKAHFGAKDTPGEDPRNLGFDVNIAGHCAGGPGSYWGEKNFSAAWRTKPPDLIWNVPGLEAYHGQDIYLTEALTREAIKAVEEAVSDQQPFYLYLSHYAVHAPWEKDDRFYQKYVDTGLKPFEATLASMIEGMDKSLGDVMAALDRLGVADNTIILFMSDNGSPSQCPPNLPLRGHKLTPYEGGIREPMIVKWPGVTAPATVCREPVVIEDFFPTILELAGADWRGKTVQTVDGISFVPFLKGEGKAPADRAFVWHFPHNYGQTPFSAIRQGPWKLIYHHSDRRLELFNIEADISETRDLAKEKPAKLAALAKLLGERLRAEAALMPTEKATGKPVPMPDEVADAQADATPADTASDRPHSVAESNTPAAADVWLLGGQSNMQGIAKIADLPADIPRAIPHTSFWNGTDFEPLELGTTKTSTRAGEFGPEVGFALDLATADRPVHLIKYHASGMPLHHGWHGNQWVGGEPQPGRRNFHPGERRDDPNQGTLYRAMLAQFKAGVGHLQQHGLQPNIRGFLWMQGEQDSKHAESATSYAASLRRLRERLAADLGTAPDLPLAFGQVLPHEPALDRFTHRTELRAQMAAADLNSGRPEAMPRTKMVSTDGFGLAPDTVHYNADGQLRLGRGLAAAMKAITAADAALRQFRVLSFNILQGGSPSAANVGFYEKDFGGSRREVVARVIRESGAEVVCLQEDDASGRLASVLGTNWHRAGAIYSKFPLTPITADAYFTVCRVDLGAAQSVVVVNTHWWPRADGTEVIRKRLMAGTLPADAAALERLVLKASDSTAGPRGCQRTLDAVGPFLKAGERVILAGDFNEPSHLDWTRRAANEGMDRLVKNPTDTPFRFRIAWSGSRLLEQTGLRDAYRTIHPDEVAKPGITWTPPYPNGTPGRRPWDDQVLTRIDRIYFGGPDLRAADAAVIGESTETSEIGFDGRWPSDHRAVLATFEIESGGKPGPPAAFASKVPPSAIAKRLEWRGIAIEEPDFTIWGASPIKAEGRFHLFAARWPEANVDPAWRKSSEIAHYIADPPEGPFQFQSVVVKGSGHTGEWDAFAPHNPEIQRFGNTYALCYIANSDFHQPPHPLNQQIGMLVSDSVNGPWRKAGDNGLILGPSPDPEHFSHGKQVVNPALLEVGGKFHLYYKTRGNGGTLYGLAVADELTGPYRMRNEPITTRGVFIEDASVFPWDGKVCLLTTDNHGKVTGVRGGGALWVSDDGIRFNPEWTQLGFDRIPSYYAGYDPARVSKVYGGDPKFERPKVLCLDGRPAWLYAPSGWNVTGGQRTVAHVLKINLQPGDGPLGSSPATLAEPEPSP